MPAPFAPFRPLCPTARPSPRQAACPTCATLFGNSGQGILLGPGQPTSTCLDHRPTKVTERRTTLQFRAEFFNLFNHPQFNQVAPSSGTGGTVSQLPNVASASAGTITSTSVNSARHSARLEIHFLAHRKIGSPTSAAHTLCRGVSIVESLLMNEALKQAWEMLRASATQMGENPTIEEMRAFVENTRSSAQCRSRPASSSAWPMKTASPASGEPAEGPPHRTILYLHGGGYILGSSAAWKGLTGELALRCRRACSVARLPVAPEHPFPAAVEDALAAYRSGCWATEFPRSLSSLQETRPVVASRWPLCWPRVPPICRCPRLLT